MLRLALHPIPTKPGVYEAVLAEGVDPDEVIEASWRRRPRRRPFAATAWRPETRERPLPVSDTSRGKF
jgi:hypothetical protein